MTTPLVSVGMPMYNRPVEMRRALDSIINQTHKNLEIIVSNDYSPNPAIYKILDDYAAREPRIKLFHQPHDLGCYGNYQFVLQQATGEYFMYAQDDDWWEPEYVGELVKALEQTPDATVAISASEFVNDDGTHYATYRFDNENLPKLVLGEKIAFMWMGMFRLPELKKYDNDGYDIHGKDIIIMAEMLLSHQYTQVNKILYHKTLYPDKTLKVAIGRPFCYFEMYWHFTKRALFSGRVPGRDKLKLTYILPAFLLRIIQMYAALPVYFLQYQHSARKKARVEYNRWYSDD